MVEAIRRGMLSWEVVSTGRARAVPPARMISRATVLTVERGELGSGGKGVVVSGDEDGE